MGIRKIYLKCLNEVQKPVEASILFEFDTGRQVSLETDGNGTVLLPVTWGKEQFSSALVRPLNRHWARFLALEHALNNLSEHGTLVCTLSEVDPEIVNWWREPFCGVVNHDCLGIRIGIIDAGFRWPFEFSNFRFLTSDGDELDRTDLPIVSHGLLVSKIFKNWPYGEALTKAEIFFVDVSDPDLDDDKLDPAAVTAAIELLSEELKVDIINISGGYDPGEFAGTTYEQAAKNFGENIEALISDFPGLVVASAGNDMARPVCMPACLPQTVGVSGVALKGVAPEGSRLASIAHFADRMPGAEGKATEVGSFHHVWSLTSGDGVDASAPGSAIWLHLPDGSLREFEGTSFAAPIVSVALACALARRREKDPSFGLSKDILNDLCVDLGLSAERQGLGMPLKP